MSYIVGGTTYPDPEIACYMTDLEDLQNIYANKINNYFATDKIASKYYDWINNKEHIEPVYAYTPEEVIDILCFNEDDNGIVSVLPLFIYLTIKTKNWFEKIENITDEIVAYTEANVNGFNDDFLNLIKEQVLEQYPGLSKFVETVGVKEDNNAQDGISINDNFLDKFAYYWKNDCMVNIEFPNKEKISQSKSGYTDEEKRRAELIKALKENETNGK